ncbi:MAG: type II toxin-antitoxin system RelE/ParE family toxin [Desmonostoc geniculatum HA4340-LM1]|jgi:toxin ParE1/3/4|nr:type II toxin-antitoxin system RelE/ParE family toxin [Desmonostoc geniculatum HA4340-LM1]
MSRYILSAAAKQDLKDIKNYMSRFSLSAASRFLDAFEEKCLLLADFPELGRSREELAPNLRSLPVDNQVIFYRPVRNCIQVERVLSGYRDFEDIFHESEENESDRFP